MSAPGPAFVWLSGKPGAKPLTDRQAHVLLKLREYYLEHAVAPTIRELSNILRISSSNGTNDHVQALVRKGYVRAIQGGRIKNRSISLVEPKGKVIGC